MAKGGIIMDVTTAEEARVAENAGVGYFASSIRVLYGQGVLPLCQRWFNYHITIAIHCFLGLCCNGFREDSIRHS